MPPFFKKTPRLTMRKSIAAFWLNFIADLEQGKRIIVVFVIAIVVLSREYSKRGDEIRELNNKLSTQQEDSRVREAQIKDSATAIIQRVMQKSNDEVTTFLKGELGKYEELKKTNDKIIRQSIK